jgi:hypothetical protein
MITYTEKGAGLHEAISRAGHWLMQKDGVWVSSNDTAVQAIIDGYSVQDAKTYAITEVLKKAKGLRDAVVASVSVGEMASWSIKAAEAAKYRATGDAAQCPMLNIEATARNITLEALVTKVEGNSARLSAIEANIGGVDGRHRDNIAAMTSFEQICQYDYNAGWPGV